MDKTKGKGDRNMKKLGNAKLKITREYDYGLKIESKKFFNDSSVLSQFAKYKDQLGNTGAFATLEWKLGYICAMRDTGLLSVRHWNELTTMLRNEQR